MPGRDRRGRAPGIVEDAEERPTMLFADSLMNRRSVLVRRLGLIAFAALAGLFATGHEARSADDAKPSGWITLFNGKDLEGWTPKITGYPFGENYGDTFRVEGGLLKVVYDQYPDFAGKFGHLFYKHKYSKYRIKVEYRFVGDQCKGGPGWATRNSGVMLHCQPPETMSKNQEFPVSIEVQYLGGDGQHPRTTANVCTPGTHIVQKGRLITHHCTEAKSKTYHGDQWVTVEAEVHGNGAIKHYVNGELVLEYEKPQLDVNDKDTKKILNGDDTMLSEGYIALQAESHPIEFRKVELLPLDQ